MAFLALLFMLAVAVPISVAAGLAMFAVRPLRPWAAYAYLIYPLAFAFGVLGSVVAGSMTQAATPHIGTTPDSTSAALDWVVILASLGGALVSAAAGAIFGFAIANRIWWRFFATEEERQDQHGLLAITPPIAETKGAALEFGFGVVASGLESLMNVFHAARPAHKSQSKPSRGPSLL